MPGADPPNRDVCRKKIELCRRWSQAAREYSTVLLDTTGDGSPVSDAIYQALDKSNRARAALDMHRKEHGC
jgi:hypothetical protein